MQIEFVGAGKDDNSKSLDAMASSLIAKHGKPAFAIAAMMHNCRSLARGMRNDDDPHDRAQLHVLLGKELADLMNAMCALSGVRVATILEISHQLDHFEGAMDEVLRLSEIDRQAGEGAASAEAVAVLAKVIAGAK